MYYMNNITKCLKNVTHKVPQKKQQSKTTDEKEQKT